VVAFARRITSSSVSKTRIGAAGPKISSCAIAMSSVTSTSTAGA